MRKREDMQVNVAGLRRNIKNIAHNYSEAQVKVREATSNDQWGPSSTLMAEIADLTYNVVAFSEIMGILWKRLNDHGRNWRHVHKALILLEYLIKTGSEKVAQQCKENRFAIKTLETFQHIEDNKDKGQRVRDTATQLVALLDDDEKLKTERARAIKAKERSVQKISNFGSDGNTTPQSPKYPLFRDSYGLYDTRPPVKAELESARPQTAGEEELQLQLALAMSREEAEQEEQKRRSDEVRLKLALSQSENEFNSGSDSGANSSNDRSNNMLDLLGIDLDNTDSDKNGATTAVSDPWGMPIKTQPQPLNWSNGDSSTSAHISDPWSPITHKQPIASASHVLPNVLNENVDPWQSTASGLSASDPWAPATSAHTTINSNQEFDEFTLLGNRSQTKSINSDPFDLSHINNELLSTSTSNSGKKTPHSFLGENSALVNLDNLVTAPVNPPMVTQVRPTGMVNPFGLTPQPAFMTQPSTTTSAYGNASSSSLPPPLVPSPNPFLS
ncbi:epsin-2 isoform X2 [Daktulosphaira vitifoliae]|uniref:epsin-2 isoform X2 n=1 Tax=Daktulosphaira vitifoliae TaxID=58002 RepID=UPI0021AA859D|nr:epsin-2 isoform X2 [Daktulosphaira vitifoliae]